MRLWLALALGAACGAPPRDTPGPTTPGATPSAGADTERVLRVGTSGDYPPFSKDGEGFDVEVARRLAADLGYRVEWVSFRWPGLARDVEANSFDVAMGGITWRPERSVVGSMSRAVAVGAPCVLSRDEPTIGAGRVAVNRGGILERWTRTHWPAEAITTVDDNLGLPQRLAEGSVDAIVTDSFELVHFLRPGWRQRCEPMRDRKVYWVAPARAATLRPAIDAWLAEHEPLLRELRSRWLGDPAPRDAVDHLVDLLARRLELMPAVAASKREQGLPIEDVAREAVVLARALDAADAAGLERASVRALFEEQIALAKAVQARAQEVASLDLETVLRPALTSLDERILGALAGSVDDLPGIAERDLDLLAPLLADEERMRLLSALRAVRRAAR